MLLLTDEDGYDVLINENAIIMATWDDKREMTAVTCGSPDPWIWVKETPEEIYGRAIGIQAYEDEGCDGCYWEGDKDTNPDAPCTFCVRENEDAVDDHYEPDQENEPEHGEEIHVSGVPYAVPLAAIRRHEND